MFKERIFPEHLEYLEESLAFFNNRLTDTMVVSNLHGRHFTSCCWAKDDVHSGVDTCACHFFSVRSYKTQKIMKMYVNLEHRF